MKGVRSNREVVEEYISYIRGKTQLTKKKYFNLLQSLKNRRLAYVIGKNPDDIKVDEIKEKEKPLITVEGVIRDLLGTIEHISQGAYTPNTIELFIRRAYDYLAGSDSRISPEKKEEFWEKLKGYCNTLCTSIKLEKVDGGYELVNKN